MHQVITVTGRLSDRLPSGYALLEVMSSHAPKDGGEIEVSLAYVFLKEQFVQDFPIGAAVYAEGRFLSDETGNPLMNSDGRPFFMFEPYLINNLGTASMDRDDVFQARIIGNLGRDPEWRTGKSGKPFLTASVATNLTNSDNQKTTVWFGLTQSNSETLLRTRKRGVEIRHEKGDMLYVEGRVDIDAITGGPKTWKAKDGRTLSEYKLFTYYVLLVSKFTNSPEPPPMWHEGEIPF